jgi:tetratricopeptide (TPR) repeat protein
MSQLNVGTSWLAEARRSRDVAFDSALAHYRRAFTSEPALEFNTFFNQQYGTILLGAGLPDSARATFQRMAARSPIDRARALRSLGYLDATEGRWRSAAEQFARAAELSSASREQTSTLRNDALHADLLLTLGDRAGAAVPLARATAIALREPIEVQAIIFPALAEVKAGNVPAARRLLQRMRALARPEHRGEQAAILTVEGALALADGRAAGAVEALNGALARDTSRVTTYMLLARAHAALGEDSTAAALWDRIDRQVRFGVEGQFESQFAAYERGKLLESMGEPEQAIEAYRRIVGRYPPSAERPVPPALADTRARLNQLEQRR